MNKEERDKADVKDKEEIETVAEKQPELTR